MMASLRAAIITAALACSISLFGLTVDSAIHSSELQGPLRDLDVVELWCGRATLVSAAQSLGLQAVGLDRLVPPDARDHGRVLDDITTLQGFRSAVRLVMRLRLGGLLHQGPECSSFIFAPTVHTGRSKLNFAGRPESSMAQDGNMKAHIAMFLFCLALARGCETSLENPAGSMIFSFLEPHFQRLFEVASQVQEPARPFRPTYCDRCAYTDPRSPGVSNEEPVYKKKYKWICSGTWIRHAMRNCACSNPRGHTPLMDTVVVGDKTQRNGRSEDLKLSAAYPFKLGEDIVHAWRKHDLVSDGHSDAMEDGDSSARKRAHAGLAAYKERVAAKAAQEDPWGFQESTSGPRAAGNGRSGGGKRLAEDDPWGAADAKRRRQGPATPQSTSRTAQASSQDWSDPWSSTPSKLKPSKTVGRPSSVLSPTDPWGDDPWA